MIRAGLDRAVDLPGVENPEGNSVSPAGRMTKRTGATPRLPSRQRSRTLSLGCARSTNITLLVERFTCMWMTGNLPVPETMEDWQPYRTPDDVEIKCWEALKVLTEDEQATALAIYDGYWYPDNSPVLTRLRVRNGLWGGEKYWSAEVEDAIGRKAYSLSGDHS